MEKLQYIKDKLSIMWQLIISHNYMVITEEDIHGHVCDDRADRIMQEQAILAKHKLVQSAETRQNYYQG